MMSCQLVCSKVLTFPRIPNECHRICNTRRLGREVHYIRVEKDRGDRNPVARMRPSGTGDNGASRGNIESSGSGACFQVGVASLRQVGALCLAAKLAEDRLFGRFWSQRQESVFYLSPLIVWV